MARYIDADKLCKGLKEMASVQYSDKQKTILGVVSTIENTPTADVVEVVRCSECKFMKFNSSSETCHCKRRGYYSEEVQPTDFCSCGAPKERGGEK